MVNRYFLRIQFLVSLVLMTVPTYTPGSEYKCDFKTINIVTGESGTTYYDMGMDIKKLLAANQMPARVHPTSGSFDNIGKIHRDCLAQLGITQSDSLAYLKGSRDPDLEKIASNLRVVMPLHDEEVHILTRSDVKSLSDLQHRKVSVGAVGSGTAMTADVILDLSEITVLKENYAGDDALEALKQGEIDAMFYVIGYPFSLLEENVSAKDNLHFLPVTHKSVLELYPKKQIPSDAYSFINTPVDTVSVRSILFTWNYKHAYCPIVSRTAALIEENIEHLRVNGHSKWMDAEIDKNLLGWKRFECDNKQVGVQPKPNSEDLLHDSIRNTVLVGIKESG